MKKSNSIKLFFLEAFSEDGVGSCKRVVGSIIILIILGCTVFLTIKYGCTDCVESLLQTFIIAACSLLGISNITGIWKNNKVSTKEKHEDE